MKEAGLARAPSATAQRPEPANDDGFSDRPAPPVPGRNTPANDNPADHDLPPCLLVTDEEVTLLHRYLSREILGLFS
jgi:hypothetical protein